MHCYSSSKSRTIHTYNHDHAHSETETAKKNPKQNLYGHNYKLMLKKKSKHATDAECDS